MNKKLIGGIAVVLVIVAVVAGTALMKKDDTKKNTAKDSSESSKTANGTSSNSSAGKPGGESDMPNMSGQNDNSSTNSSSGSSNDAVSTNRVSIKDFAFGPATIKVKAGTTVTWVNDDSAAHTVTVGSGTGPRSQPLNKGDSYSYTFANIGTYSYKCTFHPDMTGKVIVE